ncbi:MAG: hypothetical protein IT436_16775 [Phycisphaerales bacterium]|nr:hypothetical protein [Phycisphaerales bacterium]
MGLDACVFLRRESLPERLQRLILQHDPETGEWFPPDSARSSLEERCAVSERIGNIALLGELRSALQQWPNKTIHLQRFLSSGSGTGFGTEEVAAMTDEATTVRDLAQGDRYLTDFADQVHRLAAASRREGNPIVLI